MDSALAGKIRFSVIIPSLNRSDMLRQAIEALCSQENPGCAYEIIAVDNGSKDNTRQVVEALAQKSQVPIRYILEPRGGSHFARNTGFKAARGEILGLIDDDVIVDSGWVKNIVKAYDNPEVSCAGGKLTVRWINGSPPTWVAPFMGLLGEAVDYGEKQTELHYPQWISAGNLSIRKEILLKVGGYNPCTAPADKLIGDGEYGLCRKVYNSGGHIYWVPGAKGWHVQDARRITLPYIRRRGKVIGMSDAYSTYREINGNTFKIIKLLCKYSAATLFQMILILRRVLSPGPVLYNYLYKYEVNLGFMYYLIQIKTNRRLPKLVLRNDWLEV